MKRYYSLIFIVIAFIAVSCKKEFEDKTSYSNDLIQLNDYLATVIVEDVIFNGDYLEFKSKETYDSIRNFLGKLEYPDFVKWENDLGFKSARTWREEFENKLYDSKNKENCENIVKKYSDYLTVDKDQVVRYKFYAESLDRILNIKGIVKIGKSLYKFTEDNEFISYDGSMIRIDEAISNNLKSSDLNKDKLLFCLSERTNLKSSYDDIVIEGIKTVTDAKRRLIYSIHKIAYSTIYAVDIYNGGMIYQWGYGLDLTMRQQKYSWFFGYDWRNMSASYYVRDVFIDWDEQSIDGLGYTGPLGDENFSTTSGEVNYWFVDCGYRGHYWGSADFVCRTLDVSFYSSGIGEDNKVEINLTQAF